MQVNKDKGIKRISGVRLHSMLLMVYFFLAPLEDILNTSVGTLAKYLAVVIIGISVLETKGKIQLNGSVENKCIIWLMIVSTVSVLWSINRDVTLHRIISYMLIPAFCVYISTLEFSEQEFRGIVTAAIAGGLLASLIAYTNGNMLSQSMADRMILTEGNDPNNFAAFLLLPFTLSWWRAIESERRLHKCTYTICLAFLALAILMTGSRGALLSVLVMFVVYYLASGKIKKASAILGGALVFVVLLFMIRRFLPAELMFRLFSITNYTSGGAGRTSIWEIVLQKIIPEMGLFGLGAGCASVSLVEYFGFARGVHNTYLNMFCEYGLLGLPAFVIMLVFLFKHTMKRRFYIGVALLACICMAIFFLDSYAKKYFWNVILLLFIFHGTVKQEEGDEQCCG